MQCPSCGSDNRDGAKFCNDCAAPLPLLCPSCGTENRPGAKFCNDCATPLTGPVSSSKFQVAISQPPALSAQNLAPVAYTPKHLAERILSEQAAMEARGAIDGERKSITALFADIKGSTDLIEALDPEEARALIDPTLKLMMDAVHRYDGYVAQALGDGIFALFGAPIAHEDHPQRALYAALLMQEESRRYAERLRREKGVNLQIRVGLNTGEVVLRSIHKDDLHTDYVPVGHSINLASRMESLATPGMIVVSEHTHKLTEGYFDFKSLGEAQVKGVSEPVAIYEVIGVGPLRTKLQLSVRRGLARFIGRQSEMEYLRRASEQAKAGHGQIVGAMGEPGVGKSRLLYEFKLQHQQGWVVLETFSVSHGKAYPYLPLIDLLKNYFQLTNQDDERRRREKITGKVLTLDRNLEDTLPYVFFLLGIAEPTSSLQQMDSQIRRKRILEALKRLLVRESLNQPLLIIFEDLHWLDTETQAFLQLLSESIPTARMLLLVNYRPEYQHSWGGKTYYTQLRLDPLGKEQAQELLTALLGEEQLPLPSRPVLSQVEGERAGVKVVSTTLQSLHQFILDKTEGNPFFIEEIVQTLREQGMLSVETRRNASLQTDLRIPTTVQGVLTARIDRLPSEEKTLLQTLAVIGREFGASLLRKVVDQPETELLTLLSRLQASEFIYEQPAFPEVEYIFKHALTQEVAYNSLLIERRKALHERTAQAIDEVYRSRLDDHYSELAHHYSRSGNTQKAVDYLQLAGQQSARQSANTEATNHLTTALELLKTLPHTSERDRQELTLQIALGAALMATKGWAAQEVEKVYTRARELCQYIGETSQLFSVLFGLQAFYVHRAKLQTARELAEQSFSLAQRLQDPALLLEAHHLLVYNLVYLGEFTLAREYSDGIALYNPQPHSPISDDPVVCCLSHRAFALWALGYPDQALKSACDALTQAQRLSHPLSLALALTFAAVLHQFRRERQTDQEKAEAVMTLSTEQGFQYWLAWGIILRGWALTDERQEEGIARIHQGLDAYRATGAESWRPYHLALLAEGYRKAQQADEGLTVVVEALALVDKARERLWEAELYRLKGELTLQQANQKAKGKGQKSKVPKPKSQILEPQSEAEVCFLKAIEIARKQQAKSLELRATMSLARLWQSQGKHHAARNTLSEIYNWFTEGFDTKDLQEAKALLEELV